MVAAEISGVLVSDEYEELIKRLLYATINIVNTIIQSTRRYMYEKNKQERIDKSF